MRCAAMRKSFYSTVIRVYTHAHINLVLRGKSTYVAAMNTVHFPRDLRWTRGVEGGHKASYTYLSIYL